ncbi:MAG: S-methyl-5-thioribose-1-phosphate isomerase [Chloroflexi bacterium]|nr:S-methyl-5-thioribose-1-phosphate isomerase [Chloroflexota bacterium]
MRTISWDHGVVRMIDQRLLPHKLEVVGFTDYREVARAITEMYIRGAPAIGAAAGFGMALAAQNSRATTPAQLRADLTEAAGTLLAARPTAVNLRWGIERMLATADRLLPQGVQTAQAGLIDEAQQIADEDVAINQRMGAHGATLIADGDTILHHCNTGGLATVDWGTALGVIRSAHEQGKKIHVLVDETRPRLQGAHLTTWELQQWGVPHTLIADNAAGYFMAAGKVNLVTVGADRVAANGDVVNKIGTYKLACVARDNDVPFYCVAPTSTVDLRTPSGNQIPIEERDPDEVLYVDGVRIAPEGVRAANPAFDVTPNRLVTAIVTEKGIVYPPFVENLAKVVNT